MTATTAPALYLVTFPDSHAVAMSGAACRAQRDIHADRGVKIDQLTYGGFAFQPHGQEGPTLYEVIDTICEDVAPTIDQYSQYTCDKGEWSYIGIVHWAHVQREVSDQLAQAIRTIFRLADGIIVIILDSRQYIRFVPKAS